MTRSIILFYVEPHSKMIDFYIIHKCIMETLKIQFLVYFVCGFMNYENSVFTISEKTHNIINKSLKNVAEIPFTILLCV